VINDVLPSPVDLLNLADVSSAWIVLGVGHNISKYTCSISQGSVFVGSGEECYS
jgi:hypothetical protein